MLKATAGGGKGMRAVWKEEDLLKAWDGAHKNLTAAFGNDGMYLEKLNRRASSYRNSELWGFIREEACHLSEKDCSVQSHQID
jgi:acetyl-CoA carboxylase biotin carboxylase subunit